MIKDKITKKFFLWSHAFIFFIFEGPLAWTALLAHLATDHIYKMPH